MNTPVALLVAKAPVPGRVKTMLDAAVGATAAAHLAAAALLDTMKACEVVFERCYLALSGDLEAAVDGAAIAEQGRYWRLFPQQGADLSERLAHAHSDVGADAGTGVVQVGMDTPQVQPRHLADVVEALVTYPAVLGPALDGGWWVLGLRDPRAAAALVNVPMSTASTWSYTRTALERRGLAVARTVTLRDVDTVEDALVVAASAPHTGFAASWRTTELSWEAAR